MHRNRKRSVNLKRGKKDTFTGKLVTFILSIADQLRKCLEFMDSSEHFTTCRFAYCIFLISQILPGPGCSKHR